MSGATLLACDWGTTNLRAWTLNAGGGVVAARTFDFGVANLAPGTAGQVFQDQVRPALGARDLPAVLCGMIGSTLGWREAPYLDCPASLAAMHGAMIEVAPGVRIAPGLRCAGIAGAPDVMRGEETQVFGWLAQNPARRSGRRLICHPGTHAKWILVEDGAIVRFMTVMTGELFAILRANGVLRHPAEANDAEAFDAGVQAAGDGGLISARLFAARGRVVGGGAAAGSTPSYLSGLLIGSEAAAAPALIGGEGMAVDLMGDPDLCHWYARALSARGVSSQSHDGRPAALAGLIALHGQGEGS